MPGTEWHQEHSSEQDPHPLGGHSPRLETHYTGNFTNDYLTTILIRLVVLQRKSPGGWEGIRNQEPKEAFWDMICRLRPDGKYLSKGQVQGHSRMKTAKAWKEDEEEMEGRQRGDRGETERRRRGDRGEMEEKWRKEKGDGGELEGRWRGDGGEIEGRRKGDGETQ